jgi:transcriptional regulator with XRE-family HTH domain
VAQQTFGSRLAEARQIKGLTLDQVHDQLRISPAILEALEMGDFRHMPLKGHARNMVSSYARYLGLNPEEVTEQFLSEYHDFEARVAREAREARSSSAVFGLNVPQQSRIEPQPRSSQHADKADDGQGVRSMWDRPIPKSELNRGYDSRSSSAQRVAHAASRRTRSRTSHDDRLAGRSGSGSYTTRLSLPMRLFGSLFKSPVVLVIVLVIVLVALLATWAMVANSCRKQEKEVIPVNTVGSNAATGGQVTGGQTPPVNGTAGDGSNAGTGTGAAPGQTGGEDSRSGPFELAVEPVSGAAPWTEVTVDGANVLAEMLSERKTWQVTTSCTIKTGQPGNLRVTRNGEKADFDVGAENGVGTLTLEVQAPPDAQGAQGSAAGQGSQTNQ